MRVRAAIALIALLAGTASAQRMGAGARGGGFGFHHGFGRNVGARHHPFADPFGLFGYPFFTDAFDDQSYPVPSQPPVIVMQPTAAPAAPEPVREPAQPLLIELQGQRYVRVASDDQDSGMIGPTEWQDGTDAPLSPPQKLEPVVLVFRDGHREQVSDYTIADGVLYTQADYYSGGTWNKQIRLAGLNVRETIATNQARGVVFRLPASPNEVITRP